MGVQEHKRLIASEQARQVLSAGDVEQTLKIVLENGCSPFTGTTMQMRAMLALRKGQWKEAEGFIERALQMQPDMMSMKMKGDAAFLQCRYPEAEAAYRKALEFNEKAHEVWHDLGVAIVSQGRVKECHTLLQKAIDLAPDRADYHHHLAMMLVLDGQDAAGWDRMQWRMKYGGVVGAFPLPERYWQGEPLAGKKLVVRTEQGWGDAFMFAGYFPWLAEQAGELVIFCQRGLLDWMRYYYPQAKVLPNDAPPPLDLDYHVNIMCLPRLLPPEAYRRPKRKELAGEGIGINWFGSPTHKADHLRTVPVERFGAIAEAAGQNVYCLGYGRFDQKPPFVNYLIDNCADWLETSRIVEKLDLIVTVDTAMAHLGGYLGVETWLLLPFVPDFRWGMQGETTKWYESVKLYRQPKLFDWDSVFARAADDVRKRYA